nr:8824_t:CDS:2 [Entrophospora candida]
MSAITSKQSKRKRDINNKDTYDGSSGGDGEDGKVIKKSRKNDDINLIIAKAFKIGENIFLKNLQRLLRFERFQIYENKYLLRSECTDIWIKNFEGEEMVFIKAKIGGIRNLYWDGLFSIYEDDYEISLDAERKIIIIVGTVISAILAIIM